MLNAINFTACLFIVQRITKCANCPQIKSYIIQQTQIITAIYFSYATNNTQYYNINSIVCCLEYATCRFWKL